MDGKIVIGTGVDTRGLERDLSKLQKELERYVKEEDTLSNKKMLLEIDNERALDDLQTMDDRVEILQKKLENIDMQRNAIVSWKQNESNPEWIKLNEQYDRTKAKIDEITRKEEDLVATRERQIAQINEINQKLVENSINQEITKQKIANTTNELEQMRGKIDIGPALKDMGKSLEKINRRISRMVLSMIGIQTLYGAISSSVSRITSKNEELRGKINSIRNAIDNIVSKVVDLVFPIIEKIIQYVGYLIKEIFGIDIFKKSNEGAKKLEKTLAKFDEATTLNNNNKEKEYDIKPIEEGKVPGWLKWLGKNAKKLAKYLLIIAGAIIGIKTGLGLFKGLGIGLILLGIYDTIKAIIDLINSPSVDNVAKVLKGIAEIVLGIGIAFGSLPIAITGALLLVVAGLILYYEKIVGWFEKIIGYVDTFKDWLREKIGPVADILLAPITVALNFAKTLYEQFYGGIREAIGGVLKIIDGDFVGGVLDIVEGVLKNIFAIPIAIFTAFRKVLEPVVDWVDENIITPIKNFLKPIINWIDKNIVSPVKTLFTNIKTFFTEKFKNIGSVLGTAIKTGLKAVINGVLSSLESKLNKVRDIINAIIRYIKNSSIAGKLGLYNGLGEIGYISLPRLARGGIVNKVGSGIPIGSAIAGERGQEAVLPLTDSATMSLLGREIGKFITINLTNVTELDGRQIARKVTQVMNDMTFQSNGGVM